MRSHRENPTGLNRRRVTGVVFAAAVVVAAFALWPSRHHKARLDLPTEDESQPAAAAHVERPAPAAAAATKDAAPQHDPPPVIDEITVEKPEVCSGEENLITVKAHTVNGTNEFLHYAIDESMGPSVPVRLSLGKDGKVLGKHFIRVFGRSNTQVTVPLPEYKVKDCQPAHVVAIESHLQSNSRSTFEFMAKIVSLPPPNGKVEIQGSQKPFEPVSFAWNFGDGEADTTRTPVATHDYEGRKQDSQYSYFTVGVEVTNKAGEHLTGRTTIPLNNPAFESFAQKGIIHLLVALNPRYPELDSDGRVEQKVKLWHTRPEPVTIDKAEATKFFESGSGQTRPESVGVAELLGTNTIPPGKDGITTAVALDTVIDPGVFSITYRLSGKSADGHPVMGSFSVMRPPPKPTAENSRPVNDPALQSKIVAAREILQKDVVDDEDIWRLEREGRFANLSTPNNQSPANAPAARGHAQGTPAPAPVTTESPPGPPSPNHVAVGPPVPAKATPAVDPRPTQPSAPVQTK